MGEVDRKPYQKDVTDVTWVFVLLYLLLSREDSRSHSLRELFNGVRSIVRTGNQWWSMPNDLPPWPAVYQQMRRWMEAGVFKVAKHPVAKRDFVLLPRRWMVERSFAWAARFRRLA